MLVFAMAAMMIGGCSKEKAEDGPTEISWYQFGVKQDSSYDDVFNKVNELLESRYNMKLNIILTDGSNYSQKIQMMNAAQEPYDLVFTSNWTNNYYTNVENGSLIDLSELLPEYAPKLYESLTDVEKEAVTVDGGMYAVPNWQVQARAVGVCVPQVMLDMTDYTMDDFNKIEDFEPYLAEVVAQKPEYANSGSGWKPLMQYYGLISVVQEGLPGACYFKKQGKPVIVNQFDTPEFMEYAKLKRRYVEKGYRREVTAVEAKKGVPINPLSWSSWKPGLEAESRNKLGYDAQVKRISEPVLSTESIIATMTGVGAYSTHPEKAVQMLEIVFTDHEIYNMLSFGLEGVNYDFVEGKEKTIKIRDNSTYSMSNWAISSVANSYVIEGNPEDIWEQTREFNESAIVAPTIGFSPDNSSISADLGNCETVIKEYLATIEGGFEDPEIIVPEFRNALKTAGVDKVINELQRQVDEWWETKK